MKHRTGLFYGWIVLAASVVIIAVGYALRNIFSVFYPAVVEEFGWGRGGTALMFSISICVYGAMSPVAGMLVDRFKPRAVMAIGACILGGGIALCGLATTQWQFYVFYGVMGGIGLSTIGVTPLSTVLANWFVKKRGLVFGILNAGFGISLVSAPIAQFLITSFGWRTAYVIIGLSAIALITPLCTVVRGSPQEKGLLPEGLPQASSEPRALDKHYGTAAFVGEWASTDWTLTRALKTYQFWLLFMIAFCVIGFGEQIAVTHQVYFFRDAGYEPMLAATIYSVFGCAFVVGNLCAYSSDQLGREKVFIAGCLLSTGAVGLLFLITYTTALWVSFLFAIALGLGLGVAIPVFFATIADLFQGRHFGIIMGCIITGFSLGGAIAPWLAGFLHDGSGSYFGTFFMLLGCFVASAVLMWLVGQRKLRSIPDQPRS